MEHGDHCIKLMSPLIFGGRYSATDFQLSEITGWMETKHFPQTHRKCAAIPLPHTIPKKKKIGDFT
jgi:hypothetical protein